MAQQDIRVINGVPFIRRVRSCSVLGGYPFGEVNELVTVGDGHKPRVNPPIRFDRSPGEKFMAFMGCLRTPDEVPINPPDPLRDELARFAEAFPRLAEAWGSKLKFAEPRGVGLFPLGSVVATRLLGMLRVSRMDVLDALSRHDSGDWGLIGKLSDVTLDDDKRFAPELYPRAVRNAGAIEAKDGLVVSRYSLQKLLEGRGPVPATTQHSPWLAPQEGEVLEVVTWIAGNHTRTAIALSREGTVA